jgi:hypothetical protein
MEKVNHFLITALLMMGVTGCGSQDSTIKGSQSEILNEYFDAFNNHDVDGLSAIVSEDIRLMSVLPDTMTTDLKGRDKLETWLEGYFRSLPNVSSTYSDLTVREPYYSFVETATWGPDSARKQQSSLATYLIKEDKIQRVWYYYPE